MTNTYTSRCLLERLAVKSAKRRQFGSTTSGWHGPKQAAGFLSLDLKCPYKTKGTTQSSMSVSNVECKVYEIIAELLWKQGG